METLAADTKIIAVKIPGTLESSLKYKLVKCITEQMKQKMKIFRKEEDQLRSLFGDILSQTEICKILRIKHNELVIAKNDFGKPYIRDCTQIHYNISHSGEWVISIFASKPVGIDIEKIEPIDVLGIAERCFSSEEKIFLRCLVPEERVHAFYKIWTLKESYIKAVGMGLAIPLKDFSVIDTIPIGENYLLKHYYFIDGYSCSACMKDMVLPTAILIKDFEYLLEEFIEVNL